MGGCRDVALVACRTQNQVGAYTKARLASITARARVPVATARAVGRGGVRTRSGMQVARAGDVTRVARGAHDRVRPGTRSVLASECLLAFARAVARRPLSDLRACAGPP